MKISKIYVVAAIHGDEPFGLKILAQLRYYGGDKIIRQIGHPEALAKRKEYLEANLNRSFAPKTPDSKEARIAKHIMADIKRHEPDLIIDLHTCECGVGKSMIIASKDSALIEIAKRLSMEAVFIGVPSLNKVSLLGQKPKKTLVLEFGRGLRSDSLAELMAQKIAGLLEPPSETLPKMPVYSNTRLIKSREAVGVDMQNYEFNKKLGGYPYLVGKNTYTEYVGFLAAKAEQL